LEDGPIVGKNGKGAILTFMERTIAFCIAQKLPKGKKIDGEHKQTDQAVHP